MNSFSKLALLSTGILLQVGCASITGSRNQPISVTSTHEGKPIAGAYCTLINDKGTWYVNTPGSVVILKAYGDLSATCRKEDTHAGAATFQSENEGAVWGNIIAGGLIGYAVDAGTGAGFSYPPTLNIDMIKGNVLPPSVVVLTPTASSGQTPITTGIVTTQPLTPDSPVSPARAAITPVAKVATAINPAKKLEDLNTMLKKNLITQDEYDAKKTEILSNL